MSSVLLATVACSLPHLPWAELPIDSGEPARAQDSEPDIGVDSADTAWAADEVCNGIDDDGDGLVDADDPDVVGAVEGYVDADADGYGTGESGLHCPPVADNGDDCDDGNPDVRPGVFERCNGYDDNCDGLVDDEAAKVIDPIRWYPDKDDDGYGAGTSVASQCENPGTAVDNDDDCDDARAEVNPAAAEVCDGVDNDCDGLVDGQDPDAPTVRWYVDADADGYGNPAGWRDACFAPPGYVAAATDCDDADASVHPGADETCNGVDDDCDGRVDDDDPTPVDATAWFTDADGDGYGDPASYVLRCTQPGDTVDNAHDCDDADPATWACDSSPDDGTICADVYGEDLGVAPAWTGTCDPNLGHWEHDGHCYWLSETSASIADARASCAAAGGYLVSLEDTLEDDALMEHSRYVLLGACQGDDGWSWFTGEKFHYQRWSTGEPSSNTCVYDGYIPVRYRWSAIPCTHEDTFACEFGDVVVADAEESVVEGCAVTEVSPGSEAVAAEADSVVTITTDAELGDVDLAVVGSVSGPRLGAITVDGAAATWTPSESAVAGERVVATVTSASRCADGTGVTPWSWAWRVATTGGAGTFTEFAAYGSGASGLAVLDVDGDGTRELAVSNADITLLDGVESGTLSVMGTVSGGISMTALVALDADGDGNMDLAGIDAGAYELLTWHGDGAGGFEAVDRESFDDVPMDLVAMDVDMDGATDLVVALGYDAYYAWLRNDGSGDFGLRAEDGAGAVPLDLALGDVDEDGDLDVPPPATTIASTSAPTTAGTASARASPTRTRGCTPRRSTWAISTGTVTSTSWWPPTATMSSCSKGTARATSIGRKGRDSEKTCCSRVMSTGTGTWTS